MSNVQETEADWFYFSIKGPLEATSDYFIRLLRKIIRERVRSFEIRQEVEQDFDRHTVELMKEMVWTGSCRSWCKSFNIPLLAHFVPLSHIHGIVKPTNGKVTALYPGSSLHYMQTLSENRWEDYIWTYQGRTRFDYWGPGLSWIEEPERDPLGLAERETFAQTTSVPKKGSDHSFYIWDGEPLPSKRGHSRGNEVTPFSLSNEVIDKGFWWQLKRLLYLEGS